MNSDISRSGSEDLLTSLSYAGREDSIWDDVLGMTTRTMFR